MRQIRTQEARLDVQVSPLIDVVFLLLIYFMVTAALVKNEGDIAFTLPHGGTTIDQPIEVLVEIAADGRVEVDGMRFSRDDKSLAGLVTQVAGLKHIAAAQHSDFIVSLLPHQDALHSRVIDVMDACAAAGVDKLGFIKSI